MGELFQRLTSSLGVETIVALGAACALLLIAVLLFMRSQRQIEADATAQANSLLASFRDLHEQGDLSDEEFAKVKQSLGIKLRTADRPARPLAEARKEAAHGSLEERLMQAAQEVVRQKHAAQQPAASTTEATTQADPPEFEELPSTDSLPTDSLPTSDSSQTASESSQTASDPESGGAGD